MVQTRFAGAAMNARDRLIAFGLSLASLVLCGINYWRPAQRYFDEVYYPRSAAEYLQWRPQYEWTHPPLTKLLIALSMLLWGGMHSTYGNTSFGWRFLNVVVGAATVYLLYAFAKRITRSTAFASIAAVLLIFDGFHFTQSRIATPEITVAFFCLLTLYTFYRYWTLNASIEQPACDWRRLLLFAGISILAGVACSEIGIGALAHQSPAAVGLMAAFFTLTIYAAIRLRAGPRVPALGWLFAVALACGFGAASKWNALFDLVLVFIFAFGIVLLPRPRWRLPLDAFASIVLATTIAVYLASYIPFFLTAKPASFEARHDISGLMDLQQQMFYYHDVTVAKDAPHPYSSKWWEWPLLIQPVVYWYEDTRPAVLRTDPNACCISEINSLPNPVTWWFGLVTVPLLGYLAWRERRKAYLLLFVAYFVQWLPWIASPRMLFEYHFYPDDAVILLADTIALSTLWEHARNQPHAPLARIAIGVFLVTTVAAFAYFYPVLADVPITYSQWLARMWLGHWIIGPG